MKRVILVILLIGSAFLGVAFAQSLTTQINKIDVDFVRKVAMIYIQQGYYDQNNAWQSAGTTTTTEVDEPAFDSMINSLAQQNALNMEAVQQTIVNSIGG